MNEARIAIPSDLPGGLGAGVGAHFGHCDLYTLVDLKEGLIAQVSTLPTIPHEQGGCLAAVHHLASNGVTVLIAGGMGLRPLMGFNQASIEVYRGAESPTVEAAVKALINGDLERFSQENTCGGGQHHDHAQH
ncbi:MAG: NifB/NifX family molybdenum-iron cluster-binding protein [Holophaga sp.]|nr:NifB/NifX family molybdenum-iron cluster-binding protein [Holophaga sp.]